MKKFTVNGNRGTYTLSLPTSLTEITEDYLREVTDHIQVAPDYTLVGLVYRESLNSFLFLAKKNNKANLTVAPIFIKCGTTDSEFINNIKTKDALVISGSELAMGFHVNAPKNSITINNILSICEGDKNLYTDTIKDKESVYFVEFKLIPNNCIHGVIKEDTKLFVSPYIVKATNDSQVS